MNDNDNDNDNDFDAIIDFAIDEAIKCPIYMNEIILNDKDFCNMLINYKNCPKLLKYKIKLINILD